MRQINTSIFRELHAKPTGKLCVLQEKRQAFVSACRLLFVSEATPHKARLQAGSYWNASTGSGAASMSERSMSKRNASSQSKKPALGK